MKKHYRKFQKTYVLRESNRIRWIFNVGGRVVSLTPTFFYAVFLVFFFSFSSYANDALSLDKPSKPFLILLKEYRSNLNTTGWLLSEKLDGVRAYWDGQQLLSRNGHVFFAPEWFVKKFPPFELDGELWIGRNQFQEVMSVVTRHEPDERWKKVSYQVFEVPNQAGGLLSRLSVLQRYLDVSSVSHIQVIKQSVIQSDEEVETQLKRVLALKGEGLVVRRADRLYHTGRFK